MLNSLFLFLALFNKLDLLTLKLFKNNNSCVMNDLGLYINIFDGVGQEAHYGRVAPTKMGQGALLRDKTIL